MDVAESEESAQMRLDYVMDEHTPDPDPSDPCPRCGSDQLNPTCPYCQMIDTFNRALTNADR